MLILIQSVLYTGFDIQIWNILVSFLTVYFTQYKSTIWKQKYCRSLHPSIGLERQKKYLKLLDADRKMIADLRKVVWNALFPHVPFLFWGVKSGHRFQSIGFEAHLSLQHFLCAHWASPPQRAGRGRLNPPMQWTGRALTEPGAASSSLQTP